MSGAVEWVPFAAAAWVMGFWHLSRRGCHCWPQHRQQLPGVAWHSSAFDCHSAAWVLYTAEQRCSSCCAGLLLARPLRPGLAALPSVVFLLQGLHSLTRHQVPSIRQQADSKQVPTFTQQTATFAQVPERQQLP